MSRQVDYDWQKQNHDLRLQIIAQLDKLLQEYLPGTSDAMKFTVEVVTGHQKARVIGPPPILNCEVVRR